MVTASHLLEIYRARCAMQQRDITKPDPKVKQFCEDLVRQLETLDPTEEVEFFGRGSKGIDFIASGKVLATLPAHEDPKWWSEGPLA